MARSVGDLGDMEGAGRGSDSCRRREPRRRRPGGPPGARRPGQARSMPTHPRITSGGLHRWALWPLAPSARTSRQLESISPSFGSAIAGGWAPLSSRSLNRKPCFKLGMRMNDESFPGRSACRQPPGRLPSHHPCRGGPGGRCRQDRSCRTAGGEHPFAPGRRCLGRGASCQRSTPGFRRTGVERQHAPSPGLEPEQLGRGGRILQSPSTITWPTRGGVAPARTSFHAASRPVGPAPRVTSTQPATIGKRAQASAWRSSTPSGPQSA